jgi:hypothetical protein
MTNDNDSPDDNAVDLADHLIEAAAAFLEERGNISAAEIGDALGPRPVPWRRTIRMFGLPTGLYRRNKGAHHPPR